MSTIRAVALGQTLNFMRRASEYTGRGAKTGIFGPDVALLTLLGGTWLYKEGQASASKESAFTFKGFLIASQAALMQLAAEATKGLYPLLGIGWIANRWGMLHKKDDPKMHTAEMVGTAIQGSVLIGGMYGGVKLGQYTKDVFNVWDANEMNQQLQKLKAVLHQTTGRPEHLKRVVTWLEKHHIHGDELAKIQEILFRNEHPFIPKLRQVSHYLRQYGIQGNELKEIEELLRKGWDWNPDKTTHQIYLSMKRAGRRLRGLVLPEKGKTIEDLQEALHELQKHIDPLDIKTLWANKAEAFKYRKLSSRLQAFNEAQATFLSVYQKLSKKAIKGISPELATTMADMVKSASRMQGFRSLRVFYPALMVIFGSIFAASIGAKPVLGVIKFFLPKGLEPRIPDVAVPEDGIVFLDNIVGWFRRDKGPKDQNPYVRSIMNSGGDVASGILNTAGVSRREMHSMAMAGH